MNDTNKFRFEIIVKIPGIYAAKPIAQHMKFKSDADMLLKLGFFRIKSIDELTISEIRKAVDKLLEKSERWVIQFLQDGIKIHEYEYVGECYKKVTNFYLPHL